MRTANKTTSTEQLLMSSCSTCLYVLNKIEILSEHSCPSRARAVHCFSHTRKGPALSAGRSPRTAMAQRAGLKNDRRARAAKSRSLYGFFRTACSSELLGKLFKPSRPNFLQGDQTRLADRPAELARPDPGRARAGRARAPHERWTRRTRPLAATEPGRRRRG